jgi:serine/threonine protein kinase
MLHQAISLEVHVSYMPEYLLHFLSLSWSDLVETQASAHTEQVHHSAVVISLYPDDIIEFLGANVLDEKPFIVMPLLKNGNARDYVSAHPYFDILRLVRIGLIANKNYPNFNNPASSRLFGSRIPTFTTGYTWGSQRGTLGDFFVRACPYYIPSHVQLNILIDDDGKAVLCDFSLSRVRADVTSRISTTADSITVFGSRNWMAPERLEGQPLGGPCDIYSFGMTLYEVIILAPSGNQGRHPS